MDASEYSATAHNPSSNTDDDEKEELTMPAPPQDWAFNDLLIAIANQMTNEDLDEAKARFKGPDGLGRRLLETIKTPLELFDSLQKHAFLDRNNLLYLQILLYKLGRLDLFDRAVDYAQRIGGVITFRKPPAEPVNGYQYVQFHIEGTDFRKYKRSSLEALRMRLVQLLFVPPEYVIIAGIEPSSSLIITFMIPVRFVKYLEAAIEKRTPAKELTDFGIDMIQLNDQTVNLHGVEGAEIVETEEQIKLKTVYEQLQTTTDILEDREIECLKLQRRLDEMMRSQENLNEKAKAMLVNLMHTTRVKQTVPRLSNQSALAFFKHSLKQAKTLKYDKDVIDMLLDAQASVLNTRWKDIQDMQIGALRIENQGLRSQLLLVQAANKRLQIWTVLDNKEFQKQLLQNLMLSVAGVAQEIKAQIQIQFNPVVMEILTVLSRMLSPKDKQRLVATYVWSEDDELTKYMRKQDSVFLAGLLVKEIQLTGREVVFEDFIMRKLTEVKRIDLRDKFVRMLRNATNSSVSPPTGATNKPQQTGGAKRYTTKSTKHGKYRKTYQRTTSVTSTAARTNLDEQVQRLLTKVEHIEGMIQEACTFKSSIGTDYLQPNLLSQELKSDPSHLFGRYGTPVRTNQS